MNLNHAAFREFLELLPIPAYLFNGHTRRFVAANSQYCALVGYSEQELTVLPWPRIMAEDPQVPMAHIAMKTETPPDEPVQWTWRRKDGSDVSAYIRYRSVRLKTAEDTFEELLFATVVAAPGRQYLSAKQAFGG